jgi:hypothetical protein
MLGTLVATVMLELLVIVGVAIMWVPQGSREISNFSSKVEAATSFYGVLASTLALTISMCILSRKILKKVIIIFTIRINRGNVKIITIVYAY